MTFSGHAGVDFATDWAYHHETHLHQSCDHTDHDVLGDMVHLVSKALAQVYVALPNMVMVQQQTALPRPIGQELISKAFLNGTNRQI